MTEHRLISQSETNSFASNLHSLWPLSHTDSQGEEYSVALSHSVYFSLYQQGQSYQVSAKFRFRKMTTIPLPMAG